MDYFNIKLGRMEYFCYIVLIDKEKKL